MIKKLLLLSFLLLSTTADAYYPTVFNSFTGKFDYVGLTDGSTVTGSITVVGTLHINGENVCLEDGTNCPAAGLGDITDVFDCASGDCQSITMTAGDVLDTTNGTLELPQQTACNETTEGRICWDTDSDTLCVGSGAACTVIGSGSGDITSVGDCTSGACFDGTQGTTLTFNNASGDGTMTYTDVLGNLDMIWSTSGFIIGATNSVRLYGSADGVFNFEGLGGEMHNMYIDFGQVNDIWFGTSTANNIRFQGLGASFGGTITPVSNDGSSLGTTSLKWSDLFLADGAVINLNSDDITLTHGANILTGAGGTFEFSILTEGGNNVPNSSNHLGFFSSTTSTELAGVLSDEQGTGGGFVRATGSTLTTTNLSGVTTLDGTMNSTDGIVTIQGTFEVTTISGTESAIYLVSPDGSCSKCTVNNSDVFICTGVTCP
jgi:hypothetical protein